MDDTSVNGWSLEVVRGRDAGRSIALGRGEVVWATRSTASRGSTWPIRRATRPGGWRRGRRAGSLGRGLELRDLDSPGGTFVNRQRLLPGQARRAPGRAT